MKNLYIVGAGGFGREVLNLVQDIHSISGQRWNIMGFLDDTENPLYGKECDYPVCGSIQNYTPRPEDVLLIAIAAPAAKSRLVPMLLNRGAVFENCIHPAATMGRHNKVGEGVIIYGDFGMSVNCTLGNYLSLIGPGFGHDIVVGDYSTISAYVHIMGNVTIGREVFIGANSAIAPGVHVGDGAYICMGSMVMRDVPAGAKVMGNPAREIG